MSGSDKYEQREGYGVDQRGERIRLQRRNIFIKPLDLSPSASWRFWPKGRGKVERRGGGEGRWWINYVDFDCAASKPPKSTSPLSTSCTSIFHQSTISCWTNFWYWSPFPRWAGPNYQHRRCKLNAGRAVDRVGYIHPTPPCTLTDDLVGQIHP